MFYLSSRILEKFNKEQGFTEEAGNMKRFQDVVIRRRDAINVLRKQLVKANGLRRYPDDNDNRVVFSSTTVDIAANMELLKETAEACLLLLEHTGFQIRLLTKSNLLHRLMADNLIPDKYRDRIIFGFSTGTLDDRVAKAIETGTPLVSKRLNSLHWLQDRGFRTYGMICPSLPQSNYDQFSRDILSAIRHEKCEHIWSEVINLRGASLTQTEEGLRREGLKEEADAFNAVHASSEVWEQYARDTFTAHAKYVEPGKLRYLQYATEESLPWWSKQIENGAVLVGVPANEAKLTMPQLGLAKVAVLPLAKADVVFREEREAVVHNAIRFSLDAARALHEIHFYRGGVLWKNEFASFEQYCRAKWGYGRSQAYRLVQTGEVLLDLAAAQKSESTIVDRLPQNEAQLRPLLAVPKEKRAQAWMEVVDKTEPTELTALAVKRALKPYLPEPAKPEVSSSKRVGAAYKGVESLIKRLGDAIEGAPEEAELRKHLNEMHRIVRAM